MQVISILTSTSEESLKKLSLVPCCKITSRGRCSWRITDLGKLSLDFFHTAVLLDFFHTAVLLGT